MCPVKCDECSARSRRHALFHEGFTAGCDLDYRPYMVFLRDDNDDVFVRYWGQRVFEII